MIRGHIWLLVPVLSGYLLLVSNSLTRFRLLRQSGYHLFLQSALVGAGLVLLARLVEILVRGTHPLVDIIGAWWAELAPFDHSGTAALTILLAVVIVAVTNDLVDPHEATRRAAYKHGDLIEWLLQEAIEDEGLIELSTRNGRSYVGFPQESGIGARDECDISLIPLASGYRQKETGRLILTTSYAEVLLAGHAPADKFQVVIPVSEVISVRRFHPRAHAQFQAEENQAEKEAELPERPERQPRIDAGRRESCAERFALPRPRWGRLPATSRASPPSTG